MAGIYFERNIDNVLATADDICVQISCAWTVLVPKERAIEYVESYGSSPHAGFLDHDGKVIFSHGSAKITLSRQEADAIVELIKTTYMAPQ